MSKGRNLFVSFDLVFPDDNYDRMTRAVMALGGAAKLGSMLWFVDSASSGPEAEAALRPCCNPGDSLIVIDASANTVTRHNLSPVAEQRLKALWNAAPGPAPAGGGGEDRTVPIRTGTVSAAPAGDVPGWLQRLFSEKDSKAA